MDHARTVRVVERIGHTLRDTDRLIHTKLLLALDALLERLAVDERHHVIQEAV